MNRTVTMNLSGIVFHIEEDAYENLNKYLTTIKGYFENSEGKDEIMNDIEARIAEMLQEKVSASKQAVLLSDIENVIEIMGKPEDFADENTNSENKKSNESFSKNERRRRVFRDPDDNIIGGVCSGIANYFNFDPIWLRGAFAISFFVFGSGLLLYIILMMVIPKAKTTAEKLEMRGEKVDINNIGKAVSEEFEGLKTKMKDFGNEISSNENKERIKTSTQKAADFIGELFYNIFKIFGKIISIILIVIASAFMIILLASLFGSINVIHMGRMHNDLSFSLYDLSDKFFPTDMPLEFLIIGLLLFIGIPLLSIIYSGIKLLFGIKQKNKVIKYTLNILWFVGLILLINVFVITLKDFSEESTIKQNIKLEQKDTLFLTVKKTDKYFGEHYQKRSKFKFGHLKWSYLENEEDELNFLFPVTVDIVKSETDSFELVMIKMAHGSSKKEAQYRAKNISYNFTQIDSLIEFDPDFKIDQSEKWRNQEVRIILKVPQNKVIYLSNSMKHIIYDIDNITDVLDSDMVNKRWVMTKDGLQCIDCNGTEAVLPSEILIPQPPQPPQPPEPTSMQINVNKNYYYE